MRIDWSEPGTIVSTAAHAALLVALLVSFSSSSKLEDAQESIPVETISSAQFNEIMKGEKTAKALPQPQTKVDRVAPVDVRRASPPTQNAKIDVPAPPARLKRMEDPGEDAAPAAAPPPKVAAPPPPAAPPKVEPKPTLQPAAPEVKKEPPPDSPDAEIAKPVPRPTLKKQAEVPPPKPPEKPVEKPTHVAKKPAPKTDPKSKADKVAKLLEKKKLEELAADDPPPKPEKPHRHPAKPRSGAEPAETPDRRFDPNDIAHLLSKETPRSTGSTGRKASKVASLGAPNSNAPRLSPFFMKQLDRLIQEQYLKCAPNLRLDNEGYVPAFYIPYGPDWTPTSPPVLINKPRTAKQQAIVENAVRAIKNPDCNPLKLPSAYLQYYEQWNEYQSKGGGMKFDLSNDSSSG